MKNAVSGLGLAPDAAMINFPIDMFLPGSDIAPMGTHGFASCQLSPMPTSTVNGTARLTAPSMC